MAKNTVKPGEVMGTEAQGKALAPIETVGGFVGVAPKNGYITLKGKFGRSYIGYKLQTNNWPSNGVYAYSCGKTLADSTAKADKGGTDKLQVIGKIVKLGDSWADAAKLGKSAILAKLGS